MYMSCQVSTAGTARRALAEAHEERATVPYAQATAAGPREATLRAQASQQAEGRSAKSPKKRHSSTIE
jgi:hypothetical protein